MKRSTIAAAVLGGALAAVTPAPLAFAAPPQEKAAATHEYHFRQEDAAKLKQGYKDRAKVDWTHRTNLVAGGRLPADWHKRMHAVPSSLIAELPPIPAGCAIGYIDGYCVVYEPGTLAIVDVIDLQ